MDSHKACDVETKCDTGTVQIRAMRREDASVVHRMIHVSLMSH